MLRNLIHILLLPLVLAASAFGQFYGVPVRSGTEAAIPATCDKGAWYWANDSAPGLNLFFCTSANAWTRSTSISIPPGPTGYQPNQTLAGCGVEYLSGLTFNVGACSYTINGVVYNSPITSKTLSTGDATNPRIDVIGVDNTGAVFVSAGTPAASPQQPTIDPATQLGLTFVFVAALATTPTGVTLRDIYEENTEWTSSVTANFNAASTSNPFRGTTDIEATAAVLTNNVTLVKPAAGTENLSNWNSLVFYIRSKAAWPTGNGGANAARSLNIFWLNGSTQIGSAVSLRDGVFGFSSSITTGYQQISIPVSVFGTGASLVTSLEIQVAGKTGSATIGFYLDAITLQGGNGIIVLPATLMNFKGTWSSSTAYGVNDTVVSGGLGYVALVANTNVAVSTVATWAALASGVPHPFGASFDGGGSALTAGKTSYFPLPYGCTIQAYTLWADTGTFTVKVWKIATGGTAIPTVSDSINTSGVSLSSGTKVRSTTLSDFTTTTVTANDFGAVNITAVSGATQLGITVECQ